nr:MAG: hypothetical protein DIU78_01960 [Pseudomonadota bacterium]
MFEPRAGRVTRSNQRVTRFTERVTRSHGSQVTAFWAGHPLLGGARAFNGAGDPLRPGENRVAKAGDPLHGAGHPLLSQTLPGAMRARER